eukprot:gene18667-20552_t
MEARRVKSAKIQRPNRTRSYSVENQTLRDSVDASQIQLTICETELKKTKEQLKCLIHLVKRAWMGDVEASVHVANIVGIAPPTLEVRADTDEIVAVPKSAALNHWASLTIGLLNRIYRAEEDERKSYQLEYLKSREKLLDKHLGGHAQDRTSTDEVAGRISRNMLKKLQEDDSRAERSNLLLKEELVQQKEKLKKKPPKFKLYPHTKETPIIANHLDSDFSMSATGLLEKNTAAKLTKENLEKVQSNTEKPLTAKTSSNTTRPHTSKRIERNNFKVQISSQQRPCSAKLAHNHGSTKSTTAMQNSNRRRSLESAFRREEYKLDRIERDLKKTTSELQRKLNIDPKGFLNLR